MSLPYLDEQKRIVFPEVSEADEHGIIGAGGNLSPGFLLSAYEQGIFPWYSDDEPILWWSPDPRFVLYTNEFHCPRSLKKTVKKQLFNLSSDTAFTEVMRLCGEAYRPDQNGTWITDDMIGGYSKLHELGYAHSFEVWEDCNLVGGLYGVSLGNCFFGESMFANVSNASKVGFYYAVHYLDSVGIDMIDSQVKTDHVKRFGAREIPREKYMNELNQRVQYPTIKGSWEKSFGLFLKNK